MSYVITSACTGVCAGSCVDECPVECIEGPLPLEQARAAGLQLFIDPERCIDCNACVRVCPEQAIHPADALPAGEEGAAARNAAFFASRRAG